MGDLISGTLKRQSTFPEENQFPHKRFMMSISQDRATLHGLGEEICQKMYGSFFSWRMSVFIILQLFIIIININNNIVKI